MDPRRPRPGGDPVIYVLFVAFVLLLCVVMAGAAVVELRRERRATR